MQFAGAVLQAAHPEGVKVGVEDRLAKFKGSFAQDLTDVQILNRFVLGVECCALDAHQHATLKDLFAEKFAVDPVRSVYVVGSAKLGFSIAPEKRYTIISEESDIDVAIVSRNLFVDMWRQLSPLQYRSGWKSRNLFNRYLAKGWIRPDLLPFGHSDIREDWFDFTFNARRTGASDGRKIAAGVYYDLDFLRSYHLRSIALCREAYQMEQLQP